MSVTADSGSEVTAGRSVFVASVAITALLYAIPYGHYVAYPLVLLSTLVHELGHGLTAVLVGGNFHDFRMWLDGSGVATHSGHYGALASALVSAGGLVGPAIAAAIGLACSRRAKAARAFLLLIGLGLAVAEIVVVRNMFGWVFVGVLAFLCLAIAMGAPARTAQVSVIFLSVQLALAVFSRSDYLFTAVAETSSGQMPSDVAQMASALGGPYWFWGALCALVSVAALAVGAFALLRRR